MKILHILRSLDDQRALATAREHARKHDCSLLLLQDAVLAPAVHFPGQVYLSREDLEARGGEDAFDSVTYEQIVDMIFAHDRVVSW